MTRGVSRSLPFVCLAVVLGGGQRRTPVWKQIVEQERKYFPFHFKNKSRGCEFLLFLLLPPNNSILAD